MVSLVSGFRRYTLPRYERASGAVENFWAPLAPGPWRPYFRGLAGIRFKHKRLIQASLIQMRGFRQRLWSSTRLEQSWTGAGPSSRKAPLGPGPEALRWTGPDLQISGATAMRLPWRRSAGGNSPGRSLTYCIECCWKIWSATSRKPSPTRTPRSSSIAAAASAPPSVGALLPIERNAPSADLPMQTAFDPVFGSSATIGN